jgi:FtsZ-binding cell division protein ZapB
LIELKDVTPEAALGGGVGVSVLWMLFKKLVLRSAVDSTATTAADAKTDVISLLRSEIRRLGEQNAELAEKLNSMQMENIRLRGEMSGLRDKMNVMTEELNAIARRSANNRPHDSHERREEIHP